MTRPALTLEGLTSRVLRLPFKGEWGLAPFVWPPILPDGRHVILVGRPAGQAASVLFLVPLDGAAPRALFTLPGPQRGRLDLSPDGHTLLFSSEGPSGLAVFALDLN